MVKMEKQADKNVKYLLLQISLVFSSASFHGESYFEHKTNWDTSAYVVVFLYVLTRSISLVLLDLVRATTYNIYKECPIINTKCYKRENTFFRKKKSSSFLFGFHTSVS